MLKQNLRKALDALNAGGVIAYPTEAVWGLGCDPFNPLAVEKILHLKQRPVEKGLIVVAGDIAQVEELIAPLSAAEKQLLADSWPGAVTWLLPDPDQCFPGWIRGKFSSVAVRVSAHPQVKQLCLAYGGPLVSTSANPAASPPARSRQRVMSWFGRQVDYVLPGRLGSNAKPSVIRDLRSGNTLRS
ncbi:MAG: L-threonylcarbamoyladenylate synthase [Pseudomonadota bacterium]